jgi:hypothetical protein
LKETFIEFHYLIERIVSALEVVSIGGCMVMHVLYEEYQFIFGEMLHSFGCKAEGSRYLFKLLTTDFRGLLQLRYSLLGDAALFL